VGDAAVVEGLEDQAGAVGRVVTGKPKEVVIRFKPPPSEELIV
jgi:hypothetical protein